MRKHQTEKLRQSRKWCGLFICLFILGGIYFLAGCADGYAEASLENPGVRVTYFDVGKGDAILIETQGHTLLIDAGYDKTYKTIQDYLTEQRIQKLDYMILTHFDKDHVGGADWIIKDYDVEEVLQPDYESDAGQYLEYCAVMEKKGMRPVLVTESVQFVLDGAEFYIYPPQKKIYEEEDNDFSLVVSMRYQEKSFLFAGDCERERLSELLEQTEFDLSHDVLKVPHHGKKERNSEEFLSAVAPETAVITDAVDQPPSDKVYDMLTTLGTEVYLTSNGTVVCLCDGDSLQVIQE